MEKKLNHTCPVCGSTHVNSDWQATDEDVNHWFTGHYVCLSCLTAYHASGAIQNGYPKNHAWNPACPRHGTEPVVLSLVDSQQLQYYCYKCGRKMAIRNGKVIVTWQPPAHHFPASTITVKEAV